MLTSAEVFAEWHKVSNAERRRLFAALCADREASKVVEGAVVAATFIEDNKRRGRAYQRAMAKLGRIVRKCLQACCLVR